MQVGVLGAHDAWCVANRFVFDRRHGLGPSEVAVINSNVEALVLHSDDVAVWVMVQQLKNFILGDVGVKGCVSRTACTAYQFLDG